MGEFNYKKSKYYSFFQEAADIYSQSGGYCFLMNSIKSIGISPRRLTWDEWDLASSVLLSFLSANNTTKGGNKRLYGISDLHIENLVKQCEEKEISLTNILDK